MIVNAFLCYHKLLLPSYPPSLLLCVHPQQRVLNDGLSLSHARQQVLKVVELNTEIILAAGQVCQDVWGLEEQRGEHHSPGTVIIKSGKAFERCVRPSPSTGGGVLLGRGRKGGDCTERIHIWQTHTGSPSHAWQRDV